MQSEVLAEKDSDCGSIGFITVALNNKNFKDFMYRYIIEGKNLVELNLSNKEKYVGKVVKMRSPMYCVGYGKEKCLCNKCAGNYFYMVGKPNIGLVTSKLATSITQLNLQKFHENLVKTQQLDINDMLV